MRVKQLSWLDVCILFVVELKGEWSMRKGILVIESDSTERRHIKKIFSNDYVVTFAFNATEALKIMAGTQFPVVVFNMEQAGSDSLRDLNALKTQLGTIPMIIALTTYNNLEIEKAIVAVGVFYHLLKPYAEKDLRDLIEAAFKEWRRKYVVSSNTGKSS
jgi:CheY-like chemotaxis protein